MSTKNRPNPGKKPSERLHRCTTPEGRAFRDAMRKPDAPKDHGDKIIVRREGSAQELWEECHTAVVQQACVLCGQSPAGDIARHEVTPKHFLLVPVCPNCRKRGENGDTLVNNAWYTAVGIWTADPSQVPKTVCVIKRVKGYCVVGLPTPPPNQSDSMSARTPKLRTKRPNSASVTAVGLA